MRDNEFYRRSVIVVSVFLCVVVSALGRPAAAATSTKISWKVFSLDAHQVVNLKDIVSTNSKGVKKWSKSGSCTLSATKLRMGTGTQCKLTLRISKFGRYPSKSASVTSVRNMRTTSSGPASTTTSTPIEYRLGQSGPGGGTIFHIDKSRPIGSQYFEVACSGWKNNCDGSVDPDIEWRCYGIRLDTGWVSIGTGKRNTEKIMAGCSEEFMAARLVSEYSRNGKTDWFLPSRDELNALCNWVFNESQSSNCNGNGSGSLVAVNGGFFSGNYLSSSTAPQDNHYYSYHQHFGSGAQGNSYIRNIKGYVRPIRSF
jgi:hypothetical protein